MRFSLKVQIVAEVILKRDYGSLLGKEMNVTQPTGLEEMFGEDNLAFDPD